MTRRSRQQAEAPGQDSFLDIVANLVGILIILVMVIGAQARDAMVEAAPEPDRQVEQQADRELAAARDAAQSVEADIHQVMAKIQDEQFELAYRSKEREKVQLLVTALQRQLDEHRQQWDATQQAEYQLQRELAASRDELQELQRHLQRLENTPAEPTVIEHLPTPMAKTVFGRELHFRLLDGRLTRLPWDELVEKLKAEAPQKVWKLKDAPQITEVIGPVEGFRMQYTLKQVEHPVATRAGPAVQTRVELDRFVLLPVAEDLGQPLHEALQPAGQLDQLLDRYDPDRTTVTVWVYPDSYADFRTLKEACFRRGFLTAGRPLPEGHPIGGSPDGSRSASQ